MTALCHRTLKHFTGHILYIWNKTTKTGWCFLKFRTLFPTIKRFGGFRSQSHCLGTCTCLHPLPFGTSLMLPRIFCSLWGQACISFHKGKSKLFSHGQLVGTQKRWRYDHWRKPSHCPCARINILDKWIVQCNIRKCFPGNFKSSKSKRWWLGIYYDTWAFSGQHLQRIFVNLWLQTKGINEWASDQ